MSCDCLIVGAGMTGLGLAALLRANAPDLSVRVIDSGDPPRPPGVDYQLRVSALSGATTELLARAGVWERIHNTRASEYCAMRVWDAAQSVDGPTTIRFEAADIAAPNLGYIVENELIRFMLNAELTRSGNAVDFSTSLEDLEIDDRNAVATLGDGSRIETKLIVAADGVNSAIRRRLGFETENHDYGQHGFVTRVQSEAAHAQTAWQRFLPQGPFALLPLADGSSSVVWSCESDDALRLLRLSVVELGEQLTLASDSVLGQLRVIDTSGSFPLRAMHAMRYVRPRVALLGDAAHSVHPLAGQGANLGFKDARQLCTVLARAAMNGEDIGDIPVLRRYERPRRADNAAALYLLHGLQRMFSGRSTIPAPLRAAGMGGFDRSRALKQWFMRQATGA